MGDVESEGTVESERHSHMYNAYAHAHAHTRTHLPHLNTALFAFSECWVMLEIRNSVCTSLHGPETPINRVKISGP